MTRKMAVWLVCGAIIALLGVSVLRAQKKEHPMTKSIELWSDGGEAWLGVQLTDVTPEKARELKLPGEYGAIVNEVEEGSPAAKAGLATNDVILEFAGERVRSVAQLRRLIRETPPGRTITLQVSRGGQRRSMNVVPEARSDRAFFSPLTIPQVKTPDTFGNFRFELGGRPRLGISVDELTPQLADYFGVKQGKGVLVRDVKAGSPAEKAGLKAGDCIVRVDSTEIASIGDLQRALAKESGESSGEKREVSLTIVRNRQEQTIKAEVERSRRYIRRQIANSDDFDIDTDELDRVTGEIADEVAKQAIYFRSDGVL